MREICFIETPCPNYVFYCNISFPCSFNKSYGVFLAASIKEYHFYKYINKQFLKMQWPIGTILEHSGTFWTILEFQIDFFIIQYSIFMYYFL